MAEIDAKPIPRISVEFSGPDGLTFTIRNENMTTAQWAIAAQVVATVAQSMIVQTMAAPAAGQIVRATAGILAGLGRPQG